MVSYVARRKRWWNKLKSMDPTIELSTTIRSDLMLEASGLTETQQLMVLTSIGNSRDFDKVVGAMMEQHSGVHVTEKPHHKPHYEKRPKGKGSYGGKGGWRRQGNMGQDHYDNDDGEYDDEEESDEVEQGGYAQEHLPFEPFGM